MNIVNIIKIVVNHSMNRDTLYVEMHKVAKNKIIPFIRIHKGKIRIHTSDIQINPRNRRMHINTYGW